MWLNGLALKVNACENAQEVTGPKAIYRASLAVRLCSTDFNEVHSERVSIIIIPVDGNDSKVASIPSLMCAKHFNVFAAASLHAHCLPPQWILVNSDQVLILENCQGFLCHCVEVAPDN